MGGNGWVLIENGGIYNIESKYACCYRYNPQSDYYAAEYQSAAHSQTNPRMAAIRTHSHPTCVSVRGYEIAPAAYRSSAILAAFWEGRRR